MSPVNNVCRLWQGSCPLWHYPFQEARTLATSGKSRSWFLACQAVPLAYRRAPTFLSSGALGPYLCKASGAHVHMLWGLPQGTRPPTGCN